MTTTTETRTTPAPADRTDLVDRLEELAVMTPFLPFLRTDEIRAHVAGVRAYLRDDVLRQAHEEERSMLPLLHRLGAHGARVRAALTAEHDTIREAAGQLDLRAARPMTTTSVERLSGLLVGVETLLGGHFAREAAAEQHMGLRPWG